MRDRGVCHSGEGADPPDDSAPVALAQLTRWASRTRVSLGVAEVAVEDGQVGVALLLHQDGRQLDAVGRVLEQGQVPGPRSRVCGACSKGCAAAWPRAAHCGRPLTLRGTGAMLLTSLGPRASRGEWGSTPCSTGTRRCRRTSTLRQAWPGQRCCVATELLPRASPPPRPARSTLTSAIGGLVDADARVVEQGVGSAARTHARTHAAGKRMSLKRCGLWQVRPAARSTSRTCAPAHVVEDKELDAAVRALLRALQVAA